MKTISAESLAKAAIRAVWYLLMSPMLLVIGIMALFEWAFESETDKIIRHNRARHAARYAARS